jgi:hypothetical protein
MKRIWKAVGVFVVIILVLSFIGNIIEVNEREEYYKEELMRLIVSANDILTIIVQNHPESVDYISLYHTLIRKFDRINMFINHSNNYLVVDFKPMVFYTINRELNTHLEDDVISSSEMDYLKSLKSIMSDLIGELRDRENEWDVHSVDLDLRIEEIHDSMWDLEYEFQ